MQSYIVPMLKKNVRRVFRLFKKPPKVLIPSAKRMHQYDRHLVVGKKVLDVGTGSGVLAEMAFKKGAMEVTAIDINPAAVKAAADRVPRAKVLHSNLFEKVEDTYDTIIFAAPWSEGEVKKPFDHAIFDTGVSERFFRDVGKYLQKDGRIWFEYSDAFPENFNRLEKLINDNGFVIDKQWSYEDWGELVERNVGVYLFEIKTLN